ncbi:hypothetical protein GP486_008277 [Trichoglossum hirsutum]|uniref:Cytochrome P450 n=1 Tax=Trichoglossum hirsutum TaxID=265104 RepID=A0A9P8L771_9PEZI|nr:hypothetical protein GP486_008277 [Trichoglossum hirsutum]
MALPFTAQALFFLFTVYILLRFFDASLRDAHFRCFARAHGCAEPRRERNSLPYGIDDIVRILRFKGDFLEDVFHERYRRYGSTHKQHGVIGEIIHTVEPRNLQAILSLKFMDFEVGKRRRRNLKDIVGYGIFTADGKDWERSRAALRPFFGKVKGVGLEALEVHVGNLLEVLGRTIGEEGWTGEVDLMELFSRLTMDSSTEFLFGESMGSQLAGLEAEFPADSKMTFPEAYATANAWVGFRFRLPEFAWPLTALPFTSRRRRLDEALRLEEFQSTEGHAANGGGSRDGKAQHAESEDEEDGKQQRFVLLDALVGEIHNPTVLRDELLQLFFASRDTTAYLLSWCFLLLSLHPCYFQRLRVSILSHFPRQSKQTSSTTITTAITPSSLKACKPLTYFINETLRLYPVTPYNGRRATRNTALPTGGGPAGDQPVAVKKGQIVAYCVYVMHRREDIWGADAAEFRPERWAGRAVGGRWEYLPFTGGPRVCLGQETALASAGYTIVRLLQEFEAITQPIGHTKNDVKKCLNVLLSPEGGVRVRLRKAAA